MRGANSSDLCRWRRSLCLLKLQPLHLLLCHAGSVIGPFQLGAQDVQLSSSGEGRYGGSKTIPVGENDSYFAVATSSNLFFSSNSSDCVLSSATGQGVSTGHQELQGHTSLHGSSLDLCLL